jgi:hypothetical protein
MSAPHSPTLGKMKPNLALAAASRRSAAIAITAPAPTTAPWTAAITGRLHRRIAAISRPVARVKASSAASTARAGGG